MVPDELKSVFEGVVEGRLARAAWQEYLENNPEKPNLQNLRLVSKIRKVPLEIMVDLPLLLAQATFLQPQKLIEIWDTLAASMDDGWTIPLPVLEPGGQRLPSGLWQLLWDTLEAPEIGKIVDIGPHYVTYLEPWQRTAITEAMLDRPGMHEVAYRNSNNPDPTLERLATCPAGSFGHAYYHHMVDNNLSLDLVEPANYTFLSSNVTFISKRILQTHDFWHVALDYGVTGSEELALQAVTLAQTAGAFPAYFLTMLITRQLFFSPSQMPYILDLLLKGWQTGRRNPPLLTIAWEEIWQMPLDELREKYGIVTAAPIALKF